MEQNNSQIGRQEAGLAAVSSGIIIVGSIPINVPAGATSGGKPASANGVTRDSANVATADACGGGAASGGVGVDTSANGVVGGGASDFVPTSGAAVGSGVGSDVVPSSKKRRIQRHTQLQINALEMYFKEDAHPNGRKRNELAQTLGMEPMQVLCWFQNKRTQMKTQSKREENEALRYENDVFRAQNQHFKEVLGKNICPKCGVGSFQPSAEEITLRSENICIREKIKQLKSVITWCMGDEDLQNLPMVFQDSQNLPMRIPNRQNLQIISQNQRNIDIMSQNPHDLHTMFKADNERTNNTSSRDRLNKVNLPTLNEFRQSIIELVVSAAKELKQMTMANQPLWISSSADDTTNILNEVEYLAKFHNNFGLTRLGYTCEASRHIARVLLSPAQLLTILMNVNEWALIFSSIVSRALTLGVINHSIDHNTTLIVVDAEYHILTPHIPKREICFARYCTRYSDGMWAVVDVSLDNILPNLGNTTCQKKPSGCLIQAMADGTSMITWIEHVYVDYNDVSNMYKHLILSGLGFGAKRWVSILDRQGQRLVNAMSSNVPSTREVDNLLMSSPEGRRGILKFAERMENNFFSGITGPKAGRWKKFNWSFDDDVKLMSTKVMDDPGIQNGNLLSVSTSFTLSDSPKMVFDFLRDHRCRKEWDIRAIENEYEPIFNISYGEGAGNLVSIYKVPRTRHGHKLLLQESWSDAVASHIVFSFIETRSIDVILRGGNPNCLPLLPSGFTILPDGPSFGEEGTSKTLLTVSLQVLVNRSPMADITLEDAAGVVEFLRRTCENIKNTLNAVDSNI